MKKIEHIIEYIVDGDDLIYNDNHGKLIRCKDCKWSDEHFFDNISALKGTLRCRYHGITRQHNWFCADGKEKDNENPT